MALHPAENLFQVLDDIAALCDFDHFYSGKNGLTLHVNDQGHVFHAPGNDTPLKRATLIRDALRNRDT